MMISDEDGSKNDMALAACPPWQGRIHLYFI
jgi:hypothetical protein